MTTDETVLAQIKDRGLPGPIQKALDDSRVLTILAEFSPILAGTFPIGIHIADSDLDVICHGQDLRHFLARCRAAFADNHVYGDFKKTIGGRESALVRFCSGGIPIECFAQDVPPLQQHAVRHMLVEHRILMRGGASFRQKVIQLKQAGLKTEPAFGRLLGLEGDPYGALFDMSFWSEEKLDSWLISR